MAMEWITAIDKRFVATVFHMIYMKQARGGEQKWRSPRKMENQTYFHEKQTKETFSMRKRKTDQFKIIRKKKLFLGRKIFFIASFEKYRGIVVPKNGTALQKILFLP